MSSPMHPSEATPTARPGLRLSAVPMLPMPVALVGSEQDGLIRAVQGDSLAGGQQAACGKRLLSGR